MPPIRVLHLIPTLAGGGAERQLVNVVRSTSREIVDHTVCVLSQPDFFAAQITGASYRVIDLGITGNRPFFQAARGFRRVIGDERPDIIHTWLYDANISARLASLPFSEVPVITSLQLPDYEPEAARIGSWNPYKVWGLKMIDKITAAMTRPQFVACSEFVKRSYTRHYGIDSERVEVIYNAVDEEGLAAPAGAADEVRRELRLSADAFIYLSVGRLDPQKNHKTLLSAFREVLVDVPDAHLLIAGVGRLEAELKAIAASLGIERNVSFLGIRSDVGALLELADVFVFPSLFEGLGVGLIEAMVKSLPCIASRIEVFEEIISDKKDGWLVEPTSSTDLKDAMIALYRDAGLRRSLGTAASNTATEKFNAAMTARQWEDLYARVVRKNPNS